MKNTLLTDFVTAFYGTDFDTQTLKTQLEVYTVMFNECDNISLQDIIIRMRNLSSSQRSLMSEVCRLTQLLVS